MLCCAGICADGFATLVFVKGKASIYLIGPMGSGKTAVGRQLARLLDVRFYDSDAEIERRTGVDIPFIFEREGEPGFRLREREAIEALTSLLEPIVLATGGGAVLAPENRRLLAERGTPSCSWKPRWRSSCSESVRARADRCCRAAKTCPNG